MRVASIKLKIPFYDTDSLNLVWFGNYFKYFDQARTKLLDDVNINIYKKKRYIWPVIETNCKFFSKLSYNDEIIIKAKLVKNSHMLKILYSIYKDKKKVAYGYTKQVFVEKSSNNSLKKIPKNILKKIYNE